MDKIIEKKLPSGKRKVMVHDLGGHEIDGVYLKGLRSRPYQLTRMDRSSFAGMIDDPTNPMSELIFMRGTPSQFYQQGWTIHLWPIPLSDWIIQFRLRKKNAVSALP